jgi:hypothetical protein
VPPIFRIAKGATHLSYDPIGASHLLTDSRAALFASQIDEVDGGALSFSTKKVG